MFNWFAIKCPVKDESRQWVEERMAWVVNEFGPDFMRQAKVICPTPEYFPDPYDGSEEATRAMFARVCKYLKIDHSRVALRIIEDQTKEREESLGMQTQIGAAGTYQSGDWSHQEIICIERGGLNDPMGLVATMAHELCHAHLIGDGRVLPEEDDHEPLTDLLTVCMGMGIFGANSNVRDTAWSDAQKHGWSVQKKGYLYQSTWGYALAVFAWVRGEERPKWSKHLRPDVRKALKQSLAYLAKYGVKERSLLE
jgi:hypothetical protein